MRLIFTKMHGLGNDFVVLDGIRQSFSLTPEQVRSIADRHFGVGCDQVLIVEPASRDDVDFQYRIFNADGGEVEQCGNGARCFARFVREKGLTDKDEIIVDTRAGIIILRIEADSSIRVNMGVPQFDPKALPFDVPGREKNYILEVDGKTIEIGAVAIGNPHAVQFVEDVESAPVDRLGRKIVNHVRFPNGVNAGFMQIVDRSHIKLRVFERGAGETLACGSGACAAVVIGRQAGVLDDRVRVELPGGTLQIDWAGENQAVFITGPAVTVFEGEIELDQMHD